jgi:tRNA(adenine34) deaminase
MYDDAMGLAIEQARAALASGDVPVGAVVLDAEGAVIALAHNERELTGDPTAHAEVLALRRAAASSCGVLRRRECETSRGLSAANRLGGLHSREEDGTPPNSSPALGSSTQDGDGWRLEGCTLVVTLEPCVMCAGAIIAARVGRVVFGAWDEKAGAAGSVWALLRDNRANHRVEVTGGVRESECATLLREFFSAKR